MDDDLLFRTDRLRVRRLRADDLAGMLAVYGDVEAMRWVDDGEPLSTEDAVRWIEVTANNYATRGYGMSVLELRDGGALVGFCGLVHPGGQPEPELKYALGREHWGAGLATEAAIGMLEYARGQLGLEEVIATVAPEHGASQRVLGKAGFTLDGQRTNEDGSMTSVFRWHGESATD